MYIPFLTLFYTRLAQRVQDPGNTLADCWLLIVNASQDPHLTHSYLFTYIICLSLFLVFQCVTFYSIVFYIFFSLLCYFNFTLFPVSAISTI